MGRYFSEKSRKLFDSISRYCFTENAALRHRLKQQINNPDNLTAAFHTVTNSLEENIKEFQKGF